MPHNIDLRLAVSDLTVGDQPIKIKCREHKGDDTNSLAVYPDHLYCYGCKFCIPSNHTLDALAYLLKETPAEAARVAAKYTNEALDGYRERAAQEARRDPLPSSLADIYSGVLSLIRSHRRDWFYDRGLTDRAIGEFKLGHNGIAFTIPIFDAAGNLLAIRYRRDDEYSTEGPKYWGDKGRNGRYLFPEVQLARLMPFDNYLVVCEGELDAIRVWQEGIPAVTVTNGAGQTPAIPAMIREKYPFITTLVIATDQDEAGEEAARLTRLAAIAAGYDPLLISRASWPEGKDITEGLAHGYDIREALAIHFGG